MADPAVSLVRETLAAYLADPGNSDYWAQFTEARRELAQALSALGRREQHHPLVAATRALLTELLTANALDATVSTDDLARAAALATDGGPSLLGAMLLVPAWQWPAAPLLRDVQDWLWGDYAAWLFAGPQGFNAPGEAEVFAAHTLRRLEELAQWVDRNAGSATVRAALDGYVRTANAIPLYFSQGSLRRHAELRGRLLTRAALAHRDTHDPMPEPRTGRRLRVGFVNRHFGPQTETYTTLPTFEDLDAQRFEVLLFAHRLTDTPLEAYCRQRAASFHLLPADLQAQLRTLREAQLDVVVFGTNLTAVVHEVTRLALYRVAPLQVVNNSSCITSGFPQIDLYVSGDLTELPEAAEHFTERLALLPGPAHAFNYHADAQPASQTFSREQWGIPADAPLFVSAANYYKILPEMQVAWAQLLATTPDARLLVHPFNPNWSSHYPIKRFQADFTRILAQHGVAADRLIISTGRFPSRTDVKALMQLGDVYLDTFPFGGVNSLIDPLETGVPTVVWEGQTFRARMGAALLRSLELNELIATDRDSYLAIARQLATDPDRRAQLRAQIQAKMERLPLFLDSLAASDAFGSLLELAYDELVLSGRDLFRQQRTPLAPDYVSDVASNLSAASYLFEAGMPAEAESQARRLLASAPNSPQVRHLLGAALVRQDRPEPAVNYLLAAIQHSEGDASVWHDLAIALRRLHREADAWQALQTSLERDPLRLESWLMMGDWAREAGDTERLEAVQDAVRSFGDDARAQAWLAATPSAA